MSFCTKCGNELSQSINFCTQCGEKQKIELDRQNSQPQPTQKIKKPKRVYATALLFILIGITYFALGIMMFEKGIVMTLFFFAFAFPFLYSSYHLFKSNPVKLKYWSIAFIVMAIGTFAAQYLNPESSSNGAYIFFFLLSLLPGLSDKPYKEYLASLNKNTEV
jgi:hypothetical protein